MNQTFIIEDEKIKLRFSIPEIETRIYNLRRELARQFWAARRGKINILEALENTHELVAIFPENYIELANQLQHKVMNQITKKYGKVQMERKGISMSDVRVSAINTRQYLRSVRLPANMIG